MIPSRSYLIDVARGRHSGFPDRVLRGLLFAISTVYRLAIRIRNWGYDSGWLQSHHVAAKVVSIGNLTTGGTGKTPMTIWLAKQLGRSGQQSWLAVVSRGYRGSEGRLNDEGLEIAQAIPDLLQIQNPDRVAGANKAIDRLRQCDTNNELMPLVLLDDGFQHRRLARDVDIVLIDATNPFGFGHVLPRGLLREPIRGLRRADFAILTRSDLADADARTRVRDLVLQHNSGIGWAESRLNVTGWQDANCRSVPLPDLSGRRLLALSGIGNPAAFHQTLASCGLDIKSMINFGDHYHFAEADIVAADQQAQAANCDAIVCTAKDMVKLVPLLQQQRTHVPVYSLCTEVEFTAGLGELLALLDDRLVIRQSAELKNAG